MVKRNMRGVTKGKGRRDGQSSGARLAGEKRNAGKRSEREKKRVKVQVEIGVARNARGAAEQENVTEITSRRTREERSVEVGEEDDTGMKAQYEQREKEESPI